MAKNKKPLLQEGTVRRMMKLANMEALGDGFINERWGSKEDEYKRQDVDGVETKAGDEGGHYKDYEEKPLEEQEDELEVGAEEEGDDLGGEEEMEMELGAEEAPEEEGLEGEITITDEEAQDIIDLADKLKDAVGGEEEMEVGAEEEEEFPGGEEEMGMGMELGAEEEELPMQEGLYEAALQGLDIDLVADPARQRRVLVKEVKKRIYERVVNRLIRESQAPQARRKKKNN